MQLLPIVILVSAFVATFLLSALIQHFVRRCAARSLCHSMLPAQAEIDKLMAALDEVVAEANVERLIPQMTERELAHSMASAGVSESSLEEVVRVCTAAGRCQVSEEGIRIFGKASSDTVTIEEAPSILVKHRNLRLLGVT